MGFKPGWKFLLIHKNCNTKFAEFRKHPHDNEKRFVEGLETHRQGQEQAKDVPFIRISSSQVLLQAMIAAFSKHDVLLQNGMNFSISWIHGIQSRFVMYFKAILG